MLRRRMYSLTSKIVFVGEPKSGKSTIVAVSQLGYIPKDIPNVSGHTLIDNGTIHVDSRYTLDPRDTVDPSSYLETDLFIFCMDISDTQSFNSNVIQNKWIKKYEDDISRGRPAILMGTKSDLRETATPVIPMEKCRELCEIIGAIMYVEVSAKHLDKQQDQITSMWNEIMRRDQEYRWFRFDGLRVPKYLAGVGIPKNQDSKSKKYLVSAFVHDSFRNNESIEFPLAILNLIYEFYLLCNPVYYSNVKVNEDRRLGYSERRMAAIASYSENEDLKWSYLIMFWMDLVMILLHCICYLWFGIQLIMTANDQYTNNMAVVVLICCGVEVTLIIVSYYRLLFVEWIEYYMEFKAPLQISLECLVNLPMVTVLALYWIHADSKLISGFYGSLIMYLLHGMYSLIFVTQIWNVNYVIYEEHHKTCWIGSGCVWIISMITLLVIGCVYIGKGESTTVVIVFVVVASTSCFMIPCCGLCLFLQLMKSDNPLKF